jgi:hypothetical protein
VVAPAPSYVADQRTGRAIPTGFDPDRNAAAERLITESQSPVPGDPELGTIKKLASGQKGTWGGQSRSSPPVAGLPAVDVRNRRAFGYND